MVLAQRGSTRERYVESLNEDARRRWGYGQSQVF